MLGKPIVVSEFTCRLARGSSTHIIHLEDLDDWPSTSGVKDNAHELLLDARPGRSRLTYCFNCKIEEVFEVIKSCHEDVKRRGIAFPNFFKEVGFSVQSWAIEYVICLFDNSLSSEHKESR